MIMLKRSRPSKVKNAINAVKKFNTAVKSANNIRSKLKKERKNNKRFYTITFNSDDVPILGSKLTKSKAESKLRQGKDVITYYKSDALNIANSVDSTRSKCDPKLIFRPIPCSRRTIPNCITDR